MPSDPVFSGYKSIPPGISLVALSTHLQGILGIMIKTYLADFGGGDGKAKTLMATHGRDEVVRMPSLAEAQMEMPVIANAAAVELIQRAKIDVDQRGYIGPQMTLREVMQALHRPIIGIYGYEGMYRASAPHTQECSFSSDMVPRKMLNLLRQVDGRIFQRSDPSECVARLEWELSRILPWPTSNELMIRALCAWILIVCDYGFLPTPRDRERYESARAELTGPKFVEFMRDPANVVWNRAWTRNPNLMPRDLPEGREWWTPPEPEGRRR